MRPLKHHLKVAPGAISEGFGLGKAGAVPQYRFPMSSGYSDVDLCSRMYPNCVSISYAICSFLGVDIDTHRCMCVYHKGIWMGG